MKTNTTTQTEIIMLVKFLEKNIAFAGGLLTLTVWSIGLCIHSAVYGPLSIVPGIEVGPWVIGKLSRYYDPFFLGAMVSFAVWAWKHSPPVKRIKENAMLHGDEYLVGVLTYMFILLVLAPPVLFKIRPIVIILLVSCIFAPYGKYGQKAILPITLVATWVLNGLAVASLVMIMVFGCKWILWWGTNLIKEIPNVWVKLQAMKSS